MNTVTHVPERTNSDPDWLRWAKELHAIAQIGLTYARDDHFDRDRYARVREIAAELMAQGASMDPPEVMSLWANEQGYLTPKVDVRAVVFDDQQRILLVQEKEDARWTLPGGWADVNETPRQVVAREVLEEAGLVVEPQRLLAVYDRSVHGHRPVFPFHVYKLFIHCAWDGSEPVAGDETMAARFFPVDGLPPLSTGRVMEHQLVRMAELAANPALPPDLD